MFSQAQKGCTTSRKSDMKMKKNAGNPLTTILIVDLWIMNNIGWCSRRIIKSAKPSMHMLIVLSFGLGLFLLHGINHKSNNNYLSIHQKSPERMVAISDKSALKNHELQLELNRLKRKTLSLEILMRKMESQLRIHQSNKKMDKMLPDFASEASGGSIISTPQTESYLNPNQVQTTLFGIPICKPSFFTPRKVIQAWSEPGECWAFHGSNGNVEIELAHSAYLAYVTLEHIPKSTSLTGTIDSAPREFRVLGKFQEKYVVLGTFEYNDRGTPSQSFYFKKETKSLPLKIIMLQILSNWGNPDYTCIYRFRAHGKIFDPLAF